MSTASNQNLSLGKLGRAVTSSRSDYTTETSLGSVGGSGAANSQISMSAFSISDVGSTLSGYANVDEQTSENYDLTFSNAGPLFTSKIANNANNFTWTTNNSSAFSLSTDAGFRRTFTAGTISDLKTVMASSVVGNGNFATWTSDTQPGTWTKDGSGVNKHTYSGGTPNADPAGSGSSFAAKITTGCLRQTISVSAYSTYEIQGRFYNTSAGDRNIKAVLQTSSHTFGRNAANNTNNWDLFTDNFYTSGSTSVELRLEFTGSSGDIFMDHISLKKWAGLEYDDQTVEISGKFHEDKQSDGYNDHATRYNTAITKEVEIQDTYGGQSVACFLPGSKVLMEDGTEKNIEDIDVGDKVSTFNIKTLPDEDRGFKVWSSWTTSSYDGFTNDTAYVEHMWFDYKPYYHKIIARSLSTGLYSELNVTDEHELFVNKGYVGVMNEWEWLRAGNIDVDDKFLTNSFDELVVEQNTKVKEEVEVVNIDVEPSDVYFVENILVHNKGSN